MHIPTFDILIPAWVEVTRDRSPCDVALASSSVLQLSSGVCHVYISINIHLLHWIWLVRGSAEGCVLTATFALLTYFVIRWAYFKVLSDCDMFLATAPEMIHFHAVYICASWVYVTLAWCTCCVCFEPGIFPRIYLYEVDAFYPSAFKARRGYTAPNI